MERVLLNKVTYLVEKLKWEVMIVTTDQQGRAPFYPFPSQVRMLDLGIDYADDNDKSALAKITGYLRRRKLHRKRLTELLMKERADIVVSLYPSESSFIPAIQDGSKKVLELHFCELLPGCSITVRDCSGLLTAGALGKTNSLCVGLISLWYLPRKIKGIGETYPTSR